MMLFRFALTAILVCPLLARDAKVQPSSVKIEIDPAKPDIIQARLSRAPEANSERAAMLHKMFEEAGCTGAMLSDQEVKGARQPNVICSSAGQGGSVIVVGAHLDFAELGKGVVEDWSGAALLPSLFQSIRGTPRKHTFVFVGFTDREKGRRGSNFYVKNLSEADRAKVKAMINLDALGLSPTKIEMDGCDKGLSMKIASIAAALHLPVTGSNNATVAESDAASFARARIPIISIHSVMQSNANVLGTVKDTAAAMNMANYYDSYRLIAGYLVYLDQVLE
jgi:Iap family predicted aminopeptidase